MRNLIIAAVFATVLASPAFAQSYDPSYGTGNTIFPPNSPNVSAPIVPTDATDGVSPYAYEPEDASPAPQQRAVHRRTIAHGHVRHPRREDMQD